MCQINSGAYPAIDQRYAPSQMIATNSLQLTEVFFKLLGVFVRMMVFAINIKPATRAALARTPVAKPISGCEMRLLSMMGKTIPPTGAPETTIPMAIARCRLK